MKKHKARVLVLGMLVLGIAMLTIGIMAHLVPPALTGVGFLLLAWAHA